MVPESMESRRLSPTFFTFTINTIASLVRSVHTKRVLDAVDPEPHLNFWRLIHGQLLDMAVLEWCKLFGSDDRDRQIVHWKNIVADLDSFRSGLFNRLNLDQAAWDLYWLEMKHYRDTHVAHLDFREPRAERYPGLDHALESAYFYYDHVLAELRRHGIASYPDDIREYCGRFAEQTRMIAHKAVEATAGIEEKIY